LNLALVGARLLHEAALLVLFGVACFPAYAGPGLDHRPDFQAWRRRRVAGAATLALIGGLFWLAFTAADMSGQPADAFSPSALAGIVSDTDFGKLWALRLAGCVALILAVWSPRLRGALAPLAALVLASLAGTGHADSPEGPVGRLHQAADATHLLAAGLWIGALWALGWLVVHLPQTPETEMALRRFSGVGQLAVAVLVLTGAVNVLGVLGDPAKLLTTRYGQLLDVKLAAFVGMLALAALNRFVLSPRLATGARGDSLRRLRYQILGEQALSLLVVAIVALIGTLDPMGPANVSG
jgi:putative copper resistance protein D